MESLKLLFPYKFHLSEQQFAELQSKNSHLSLKHYGRNSILVVEKEEFYFDNYGVIELFLPDDVFFDEMQYEKLCLRNENLKIELFTNKISITMGIKELISALNFLLGLVFGNWNRNKKAGKVYDATMRYDLPTGKRLCPDVSFISIAKLSQLVETSRNKHFIQGSPNLVIEIVSGKNSLKNELDKMKNDWLPANIEIGLVINPFKEEYYVFTNSVNEKFAFNIPFTHSLLPDFVLNLAELWKEAQENSPTKKFE